MLACVFLLLGGAPHSSHKVVIDIEVQNEQMKLTHTILHFEAVPSFQFPPQTPQTPAHPPCRGSRSPTHQSRGTPAAGSPAWAAPSQPCRGKGARLYASAAGVGDHPSAGSMSCGDSRRQTRLPGFENVCTVEQTASVSSPLLLGGVPIIKPPSDVVNQADELYAL